MIKQFFKIGGVKNQKEFLAKYPTEASFFRQHPEALSLLEDTMPYMPTYSDMIMPQAMYGMGMAYGGSFMPRAQYGMQVGGVAPRQEDFPDYGSYAAAMDEYIASLQQQADTGQTMPQGAMNAAPTSSAPVSAPSPYVPTNKFNLKDYKGVSIVDFLSAQGKPANFASRKELAAALGISNYRGTASQNTQMMQMLQQNPDVLSEYDGVNQPTGGVRRSAARAQNAKAIPTTRAVAKSKQAATQAPQVARTNAVESSASALARLAGLVSQQPVVSAPAAYMSSTSIPASQLGRAENRAGEEAYLRKIAQDPGSLANIKSRKRKEFARDLAIGTLAPFLAEGALMAATTKYLPYGLRALPEVTAAARQASRALPYATRALPWKNGGSTYSAGVFYGEGGAYLPDYASNAYGLPQFELGAPTYQDGGMAPEDAMMMQQQQAGGADQQQQVIQAVMQMLQQGMDPNQIIQQLSQSGIPPQMAQQLVMTLVQQMQGGGGQEQQMAPQQGMMAKGGMTPGWEGEVTMEQLEDLRRRGVKFDII